MNGPLAYTQTQSGSSFQARNNGIFPIQCPSLSEFPNLPRKYLCVYIFLCRHSVEGLSINWPCAREREANTAGRVCFLDAKQLLPNARARRRTTKDAPISEKYFWASQNEKKKLDTVMEGERKTGGGEI
jgi:hypothetical protein